VDGIYRNEWSIITEVGGRLLLELVDDVTGIRNIPIFHSNTAWELPFTSIFATGFFQMVRLKRTEI